MNEEKTRSYIKNFFESYYDKLKNESEVLVKIPVIEGNEPMWAEGAVPDKDDWVTWKLCPAQVSDEEIAALERKIGTKLPQVLRIFLTTYFHYFDEIGRNPVEDRFSGFFNAWNPLLVRNGYLPFAWDEEGYFIRCMDLKNMPDEEKCGIVQIDHEVLFDFDEETTGREELASEMKPVAENFFVYLQDQLSGKPQEHLAIQFLDSADQPVTWEAVNELVCDIRRNWVSDALLALDEYGEEDFLSVDIEDGWAALAYNTWDEEGEAHLYQPVNPRYEASGEEAPVTIGGQTPVLKRNALDDLDIAAECVLYFAQKGELYPGLNWEEAE